MNTAYRIVLALHVISIIAWMAGVLYLFRLFVYHADESVEAVKDRFKVMESRLYNIITLPAMIAALVFGLTLIGMNPGLMKQPWLHAKLTLVAGLMFITWFGGQEVFQFGSGKGRYRSKTYRFLNEVPTLLMIGIVFLVVLKWGA